MRDKERFAKAYAAQLEIKQYAEYGIELRAIYGLFVEDRCVYIGESKSPFSRMQTHKSRRKNKAFDFEIFDLVKAEIARAAEGRWILYYQERGQAEENKFCRTSFSAADIKLEYHPSLVTGEA